MIGWPLAVRVDRCCGVDGVPADDGVGEQGEAFALKILVAGVSTSDLAQVGEE